jgi:DNA-binding transcriptional LysR family regulator
LTTTWDDYRYVQAVASSKSLAGAAEILGVNHSTVFRRINAIEETLGARIFERGRGGYALTPAGEEMVGLALRMNEEITRFERRIAGRDVKPSGELRVTIGDAMMAHLLTPVFSSFLKQCPDIRLDVVVTNASLNLSKRDADIAIRATRSPPENLVGRRVAATVWAVYGSPSLQNRDLVELYGERWVGLGENLAHIMPSKWLEERVAPERVVLRINTVQGLADAVEAGMGIGLLPCFLGDSLSSVAQLSDPIQDMGSSLWLLTHPDIRQSARVRAFMDHAWEALSRRRSQLEGRPLSAAPRE